MRFCQIPIHSSTLETSTKQRLTGTHKLRPGLMVEFCQRMVRCFVEMVKFENRAAVLNLTGAAEFQMFKDDLMDFGC